jgi:hypothetical protein
MLPRRCWRYTFCGTKTSFMQSTRPDVAFICLNNSSRNQRRQLRWTLLWSTMSNLLKQMKWWYPMSHLHSPRQVLSGEDTRQILQSVKSASPIRWTLLWSTMSNLLKQMKWWYPMSHLHSPRQVVSGEDLIENTMGNRLNKWSDVTWCRIYLPHQLAPPITAVGLI